MTQVVVALHNFLSFVTFSCFFPLLNRLSLLSLSIYIRQIGKSLPSISLAFNILHEGYIFLDIVPHYVINEFHFFFPYFFYKCFFFLLTFVLRITCYFRSRFSWSFILSVTPDYFIDNDRVYITDYKVIHENAMLH